MSRAGAFLEDVGFALLFPHSGISLPSLWEAVSRREHLHEPFTWGPDAERVWSWKDELPPAGLAWYGRFLRGRSSLLGPALLSDLYPRSGEPGDFQDARLDPHARRIAEVLLVDGPTSVAALRVGLGVEGTRSRAVFDRAITALGRQLVVTHYGTEEHGSGWPSAVMELTARAFALDPSRDREAAELRAARCFLDTVLEARPHELGNAFGWRAVRARELLEDLVARGGSISGREGVCRHRRRTSRVRVVVGSLHAWRSRGDRGRHRVGGPDLHHRGDEGRTAGRGEHLERGRRGHRGHPHGAAGPDRPVHGHTRDRPGRAPIDRPRRWVAKGQATAAGPVIAPLRTRAARGRHSDHRSHRSV